MGPPSWTVGWGQNLLDSVQKMIDAATERLSKDLSEKIEKITKKTDELVARVSEQDIQIRILQNDNTTLAERLLRMEARSMANNLIISGIDELNDEKDGDIRAALTQLFVDMKLDPGSINLIRCHRLGRVRGNKGRPRDIVAVFGGNDKYDVLSHAKNLRGHNPPVYVNQQFPNEIIKRRNILRPILKVAKSPKMKASMSGDGLLINSVWYTCNDLDLIPISSKDLEAISTVCMDEYFVFPWPHVTIQQLQFMQHDYRWSQVLLR